MLSRPAAAVAALIVVLLHAAAPARADCGARRSPPSQHALETGGELRLKYERYRNRAWDPRNGEDAYLLQRVLLHASAGGERVRTCVQFEHSGQNGGRFPADRTALDDAAFTDLYVEVAIGPQHSGGGTPLRIRAGRQELAYGAGRMLDNRYGLNTLQPFDGVLLRVAARRWAIDAFAVRPVIVAHGSFDDRPDASRSLAGAYASREAGRDTLELYALHDRRNEQFFYRGTGRDRRTTLGSRIVLVRGGLRSDTDLSWQFGTTGRAAIAAAAVENFTSYAWHAGPATWLAGIGAGLGTGDHDPRGARMTAFRPPYPTGVTFGIVQAEGATNDVGVSLQQQYAIGKFTLSTKEYASFRQSLLDGLYGPPGSPLRAPLRSRSAPIGTLAYVTSNYALSPRVSLSGAYARYAAGAFLRDSGPAPGVRSADTAYTAFTAQYRW